MSLPLFVWSFHWMISPFSCSSSFLELRLGPWRAIAMKEFGLPVCLFVC